MINSLKRYLINPLRQCRGMTLLEVLVAMVILGTILTTAVLARSRYIQQSVRAAEKQRAVAAADALLATWFADPNVFASEASGMVNGETDLSWNTHLIDQADAHDLGAKILRLEIWKHIDAQIAQPFSNLPLTSIELLVPATPPRGRPDEQGHRSDMTEEPNAHR